LAHSTIENKEKKQVVMAMGLTKEKKEKILSLIMQ